MIQHVGSIAAELEVDLSPDDEVLAQREVDICQPGPRKLFLLESPNVPGAGCVKALMLNHS